MYVHIQVAKERDTPSVVRERNAMNHFDIKGHDLDIKGHDLDDTDTSYAGAESCPFNRGKPDNGEGTTVVSHLVSLALIPYVLELSPQRL